MSSSSYKVSSLIWTMNSNSNSNFEGIMKKHEENRVNLLSDTKSSSFFNRKSFHTVQLLLVTVAFEDGVDCY